MKIIEIEIFVKEKMLLLFLRFIVLMTNDEICFSPTRIIQWRLLAIDVTDRERWPRDPLCGPTHTRRSWSGQIDISRYQTGNV